MEILSRFLSLQRGEGYAWAQSIASFLNSQKDVSQSFLIEGLYIVRETRDSFSAYVVTQSQIRPNFSYFIDMFRDRTIFIFDREVLLERKNYLKNHVLIDDYAGYFLYIPEKLVYLFEKNNYGIDFSEEQKKKLFSVIRSEVLNSYVEVKSTLFSYDPFLLEEKKIRADLAIWVKGELRGSVIVEANSLLSLIRKAVPLLLSDLRFKPLTFAEIPQSFFEVTFMSPLLLPIDKKNISESHFSLLHGLVGVSLQNTSHVGFFVPSVYKVINFSTFQQVMETLSFQKMGKFSAKDSQFYAYRSTFLKEEDTLQEVSLDVVRDYILQYLSSSLEEDGFMPFSLSPYNGEIVKIDWARLFYAGSVFAYTESIGKGCHVSRSLSIRVYKYLDSVASRMNDPYALLYASLLYSYRGEKEEALSFLSHYESIRNTRQITVHEDILYIRSLLTVSFPCRQAIIDKVLVYANQFLYDMENDHIFELVSYADIMVCLSLLLKNGKTSNDIRGLLQKISKHFLSFQHKNGHFAVFSDYSGKPYVRASAKIIESILMSDNNLLTEESLKIFFRWVNDLQIREDSQNYFIKEKFLSKCVGGIMHDDTHADIFLDSVMHVYAVLTIIKK